jgi:hypothetical protein
VDYNGQPHQCANGEAATQSRTTDGAAIKTTRWSASEVLQQLAEHDGSYIIVDYAAATGPDGTVYTSTKIIRPYEGELDVGIHGWELVENLLEEGLIKDHAVLAGTVRAYLIV